ncbi:hypothetical protein CM49_01603 [Paenibacillus sp. P1XP2]|nr:hypothetical protein CM49_01603 [Paenibacillus sp. P1XP2]
MIVNEDTKQQQVKSMETYLSPLVRNIPPSGIRKFFDLANGSKDIITLGVGEPDFTTLGMSGRLAFIPWNAE